VAQLLPRFRHQQAVEDERKVARIVQATGELLDEASAGRMPLRASANGHHRDRRRGLPVISRGTTGAMPGSDPVHALLAKERRGRL
jgi:hypothetical protein